MSNVFAQAEALMKGRTEQEAYAELKESGLDEDAIKALLGFVPQCQATLQNTLMPGWLAKK